MTFSLRGEARNARFGQSYVNRELTARSPDVWHWPNAKCCCAASGHKRTWRQRRQMKGDSRTQSSHNALLVELLLSRRRLCSSGLNERARTSATKILRIRWAFALAQVGMTEPFKDSADLERLLDGLRKPGRSS